MNKAKVLLMGIGAIGIVGGAIATKTKNNFSALRCTATSTIDCRGSNSVYKLCPFPSTIKYCDAVTAGHCTVPTKVCAD